jgi:hypothetical protein
VDGEARMLCNNCFQRTCRLHPLFDHGKRASEIKEKVKSLNSNITSLIQQQISKLEASKVGTSDDDLTKYKEEMELLRSTKQSNDDSSNSKKRKNSTINANGLNPTALSVMLANDDDESVDGNNDAKSSSSDSDSDSSASKKKSKKVRSTLNPSITALFI